MSSPNIIPTMSPMPISSPLRDSINLMPIIGPPGLLGRGLLRVNKSYNLIWALIRFICVMRLDSAILSKYSSIVPIIDYVAMRNKKKQGCTRPHQYSHHHLTFSESQSPPLMMGENIPRFGGGGGMNFGFIFEVR